MSGSKPDTQQAAHASPSQPPSENQQSTTAAASAAEPQAAPQPADEAAEDPNECAWCKWMKGGGCKSEFEVWLKCVDDVRDAGREDVESCSGIMGPLFECMQRNSDYYAAQLDTLKERKADGDGDGEKAGGGSTGLAGMAAEVVDELEELVENMMGADD